ncbi:ABC transporter permease [Actinomadura sp. KC345]|uniref:ABC transporter permease n=1 Tax=Actinomadura sp. KC345 TaxID=2530371 RepID=UPI001043B818|nr:ABC transporter permease subunit [Actinomadura sp. KC345]TDC56356.1 ABC transporter permease [Actinomadura sp. KC345]
MTGLRKPGRERRTRRFSLTVALAALLLAVPVTAAVLGPLLAPAVTPDDGAPYVTGGGHLLGTDGTGRDVLGLLLRGGRSALGVACCAVALAYLAGGPLGLAAAATRHRWVDELLMRPIELILPIPSLLVISVVGVGWRGSPVAVALAVAAINAPAVARLVRAAALDAASGPVAEAMRVQGESRPRVLFGYVGRSVLPVAAADAGTRVPVAVFTVAAANFLGLGLDPASPDWGVTIAGSREALLIQPWAVGAPAAMLVMFTVGLNLLADRLLKRGRRERPLRAKSARAETARAEAAR